MAIKQNINTAHINVIIAINFLQGRKDRKDTENCLGVPGEIYNFNTKSLISFQGNVNSKGDLPSVMYFDFETTLPTDNIFDPEQKKCLLYFMF